MKSKFQRVKYFLTFFFKNITLVYTKVKKIVQLSSPNWWVLLNNLGEDADRNYSEGTIPLITAN